VIHSGDTSPKNLPGPDPLPEPAASAGASPAEWIEAESGLDLRFTASSKGAKYDLIPMYQIHDQRYALYWQMQNKKA
jgi:hypothetical protein